MFSRNRPSGPGTRVYIRAATNPGSVGHGWVKERFISVAPPLTPVETIVSVYKPNGGNGETGQKTGVRAVDGV